MAVGSTFSPTLMGLNEYKCKYAEPVHVAPDRDIPVKKTNYNMLVKLKEIRDDRRAKAAEKREAAAPDEPREDIQPVIIGGDIGAYALGREFHEAFGVKSVCLAPSPIGGIAHSKIFTVKQTALDEDSALAAVTQVATSMPEKTVVLIANTDAHIALVDSIRKNLPSNVVACIPPADAIAKVSSKTEFAKLCEKFDLPHPETEIVRLAGSDPIAATAIPFPLVAKPATSAVYMKYLARGFKKVYFCQDQNELDQLWSDLREAGFDGDFLVQKLIPGDDTTIHSITIYMATNGKATLTASSHVLLSDHAPTMLGNPVASITQSLPDYYAKLEPMLASIGYIGFANFDLKQDPATGTIYFLECNPRIGRNSYYVAAAGVNPMRSLVADVMDGKPGPCRDAKEEMLYTLVPLKLLQRYIRDPELLHKVDTLIAEKRVVDPQRYPQDWTPRRRMDIELTEANQIRKFKLYYPQPTDTSF
jgi:D-aspartate ligase